MPCWIKSSVCALGAGIASALDIKYNTGTCWLASSLVGSATRPIEPGPHERDPLQEESEGNKIWINLKALAQEAFLRLLEEAWICRESIVNVVVQVMDAPLNHAHEVDCLEKRGEVQQGNTKAAKRLRVQGEWRWKKCYRPYLIKMEASGDVVEGHGLREGSNWATDGPSAPLRDDPLEEAGRTNQEECFAPQDRPKVLPAFLLCLYSRVIERQQEAEAETARACVKRQDLDLEQLEVDDPVGANWEGSEASLYPLDVSTSQWRDIRLHKVPEYSLYSLPVSGGQEPAPNSNFDRTLDDRIIAFLCKGIKHIRPRASRSGASAGGYRVRIAGKKVLPDDIQCLLRDGERIDLNEEHVDRRRLLLVENVIRKGLERGDAACFQISEVLSPSCLELIRVVAQLAVFAQDHGERVEAILQGSTGDLSIPDSPGIREHSGQISLGQKVKGSGTSHRGEEGVVLVDPYLRAKLALYGTRREPKKRADHRRSFITPGFLEHRNMDMMLAQLLCQESCPSWSMSEAFIRFLAE
ncbi:hypothetical protein AK812_SmicGene538 [Symbiodinium microadriaticum]|uniref:Uncharacterized protein n=1 Tax=Symbiodinium microadriaticum TaxID=2951 RepID=A0A1Q9F6H4_SYMMI|nr:hypothetical protein AK812_SmicGene538 [Symbiodinium microadriaticum]CAE7758524.1 unnamed protein product [Symbiodinium sp. KB8]